jgi:hypothetical protein
MSAKTSSESHFRLLFVVLLFFLSLSSARKPDKVRLYDAQRNGRHHEGAQALVVQPVDEELLDQSVDDLPNPTFHSVTIDYTDRELAETTDTFLRTLIQSENEPLRSNVREISVAGHDYHGNWTLVEAVFQSLHNIEAVHWYNDQPLSSAVLGSLEAFNPSAKLYYNIRFEPGNEYDRRMFENAEVRAAKRQLILNSTNLYSFSGRIDYGNVPNRQGDLRLVWQILTTCPNIRELDLTLGWFGCKSAAGQPWAFDFSSNPDARFAPLEVLKLNGYRLESTSNLEWVEEPEWDTEEWEEYVEKYRSAKPRRNPSVPEEPKKINIEQWLEAMDWSKIHTLHLNNASPKVLRLLSGRVLPSLKHLLLTGGQSKDIAIAHEEFLSNTILPLESITFQHESHMNPDRLMDITTARHGTALKHLKLTGTWSNLEERHITRLYASSPHLETLDIDMHRPPTGSQKWDFPLLSSLVSHPSPRHLTLRFPSPILEPDECYNWTTWALAESFYVDTVPRGEIKDGLVNRTVVEALFRYLREENSWVESSATRPELARGFETLEVFVDTYGERERGGMLADGRCALAHYTCTVDEDGKTVCEGEEREGGGDSVSCLV